MIDAKFVCDNSLQTLLHVVDHDHYDHTGRRGVCAAVLGVASSVRCCAIEEHRSRSGLALPSSQALSRITAGNADRRATIPYLEEPL